MGGPGLPEPRARRADSGHRREFGQGIVHHLLHLGSVSAPSESSSKSAFSHYLQRRLRTRQLRRQPRVFRRQALVLPLLGGLPARSPARRITHARQRARVPGTSPLDDVRGAQAFPAQQGTLRTRLGQSVVLLHHRQLVVRSEHPPPRTLRPRPAVPADPSSSALLNVMNNMIP